MKQNIGICLIILLLPNNLIAQTDSLTDIDGNVYKTLKIGAQTWMKENLRTTKFNDGHVIPLVEAGSVWIKLKQPAYCWYNNDTIHKNLYGTLYNWYAIETGKLCPLGWHIPSDRVYLPEVPYPCAERNYNGRFILRSFEWNCCVYWTSTECIFKDGYAYTTCVLWDGSKVTRGELLKNAGLPVRCIKDN
jgi:hypothetical protein